MRKIVVFFYIQIIYLPVVSDMLLCFQASIANNTDIYRKSSYESRTLLILVKSTSHILNWMTCFDMTYPN